jgi:ATP-dependent exoDNAse (exonuclease V) beta subunit
MTADHSQRVRALDVRGSYIVQAPAGSGKTELLTQRFLRLLAIVERPEQVLAITFTRKATQEMKERIARRLMQARQGVQADAEHERAAIEAAGNALEQDRRQGWNLLRNPGRLNIHTIDGLCARICARSPAAGPALSTVQVMDDARPLYELASRRLVEDLGADSSDKVLHDALVRVLTYLHGNTQRLADLLSDMLARRDQWTRHLAAGSEGLQQILIERQTLELEHLRSLLGAGALEAISHHLLRLAGMAEDSSSVREMIEVHQQCPPETSEKEWETRRVLSCLKQVSTKQHLPYKPGSIRYVIPGHGDDRDADISAIKEILQAWAEDPAAGPAFQRFVKSPPLEDASGQPKLLDDLRRLLKFAMAEMAVLFAEEGRGDFTYIAGQALAALGDDLEPGEALLAEDVALSHILMDEFQDTSHGQHQMLKRLVSGWQPGDGRTLFLVGDPMQSIYRFRQANVGLFTRVARTGRVADVSLESLRLSSNFRSRPELTDWFNQNFDRIFGASSGPAIDRIAYAPVDPQRDHGGSVSAHGWYEGLGDCVEAQRVAALVKDRLTQRPTADIAILAGKRKQLVPIARELQRLEIEFEAVQVEHLGDRPLVQDMLAFTRAILHPCDRVAWLGLLRGPWCGLSTAELHSLAGDEPEANLLERMNNREALSGLPKERARRVTRMWQLMSDIVSLRDKRPLHRLVESAWLASGAPYAACDGAELQNAQRFLDLLASLESEPPEDLTATLQEQLSKTYAGSVSARVKLMTIHKAKGLEFDIVILPGLQQAGAGVDRPLLRIGDVHRVKDSGVMLAPMKQQGFEGCSLYDYLGLLERENDASERQRVLYVAATRAKEELHLFSGWGMRGSGRQRRPACTAGTFLDLLWPCFEPLIDESEAEIPNADGPLEPVELPLLRLAGEPVKDIELSPSAGVSDFIPWGLPDRNAVALGEAAHLWLELAHNHGGHCLDGEWLASHGEALQASLAGFGAPAEQLERLSVSLVRLLRSAADQQDLASRFNNEAGADSWAELGLYQRSGTALTKHIIDLLFIDDEDRFRIIDYKTGRSGEEAGQHWAAQLQRYTALLATLEPRRSAQAEIFLLGESIGQFLQPPESE